MVDRHDPGLADAIFSAMVAHGTYYVPTHLTRWSDAYADDSRVREDPALEFLHPLMRMQWEEDLDGLLAEDPGADARRAYIDFHEKGLELTGRAHRAGVKVMVGTDYIVAGLDVHRELAMLVRAGLTPLEALQAATLVPAAYADRTAQHDAVAPGRIADLLLLRADPTVDIDNTREIETVVFNGNVYRRADLDRLQAHVRDRARSWTVAAEIVWRFIRNPAAY